jgi:hypothetical protein
MRIAAPPILFQRLFRQQQSSPHWIQVHIIASGFKITVAAAIDDVGLIAAAENVSEQFVPCVEPLGVGAKKPFHSFHKDSRWGFQSPHGSDCPLSNRRALGSRFWRMLPEASVRSSRSPNHPKRLLHVDLRGSSHGKSLPGIESEVCGPLPQHDLRCGGVKDKPYNLID